MSLTYVNWKRLSFVASVLAILGLAAGIFWAGYLGETLPAGPNPAAGRVHRLAYHSKCVYLTFQEHALFLGLVVFGLVALVVGIWAQTQANRCQAR